MGLSSFPSPGEGVLPLLVMNTVMSMAIVKNTLRSVFQAVGRGGSAGESENGGDDSGGGAMAGRVSITRYGSLRRRRCRCSSSDGGGGDCPVECCVCLCGFEAEEEVSELSCKHFFHKGCLDKWLDNQHTTCPLCRSIL